MKYLVNILIACCALFLISGCTTPATRQFVHFPDQGKAIENTEMGRVYVARPTVFGYAVSMKVYDGSKLIGETGPEGYLCWERKPGEATIKGEAYNTSELTLNIQKGKSYYIQQDVLTGFWAARNKLSMWFTEEEGKSMVAKCKPPKQQPKP